MLNGRNLIGMLNGRQAVGDDNRGATARQALERLLHRLLALVIQSTRRLVQDEDLGILEEHACNCDALLLSARKTAAALAHHGVVALRQRLDKGVDVGAAGGLGDFLRRGARLAVGDILANRTVKQVDILLHQTDSAAQTLLRHIAHVLAVNADGSGGHVIKTRQQRASRRLAAARRANQSDSLTRLDAQIHMVDNRTRLIGRAELNILVTKAHVAVLHGTGRHLQVGGTRLILNIGGGREHLVHAFKAGDGLLIHLGRVH